MYPFTLKSRQARRDKEEQKLVDKILSDLVEDELLGNELLGNETNNAENQCCSNESPVCAEKETLTAKPYLAFCNTSIGLVQCHKLQAILVVKKHPLNLHSYRYAHLESDEKDKLYAYDPVYGLVAIFDNGHKVLMAKDKTYNQVVTILEKLHSQLSY